MTEFQAIGRPTPLVDGRTKVAGSIRFAADLTLPGMLHARLVTSIYAHANLKGIDTSKALAVPGVVAVLTAKDLPNIIPTDRSRMMLARDRVIFQGQPVALVLATSEVAADDGLEQVQVDYDPLPVAMTIDEALAEGAPLVWPRGVPKASDIAGAHGAAVSGNGKEEEKKQSNMCGQRTMGRGDITHGFAQADVVVERTFNTAMVHQSPLETQATLVQVDPGTGGTVVWASTQSPFDVRKDVSEVLGVRESEVRVVGTPVGGGFGSKFVLYEPLVALAAKKLHRPVRLILTRMEEMLAANPAPSIRIHARLGAKRDGTLTALEGEMIVDNGCYPFWIGGLIALMLASFYRVENFKVTSTDVLTFKTSMGSYRAPGAPSTVLAIDCLMDEMAQKLNIDPLEFRLMNAAQPGDPMADGRAWPGMGMTEVLQALRDHPAWKNRSQARKEGRGVGISIGGWLGGVEPATSACRLDRDGMLDVHVGSVDLNGTLTGFTLMAAEAFGIAPEDVRVVFTDTDIAPYSGGSAGSKVTYTTGAAVVTAAREARQQALAIAAEEFEAAVEDLEIIDGKVQVKGVPSKAISLADLAGKTMHFGGKHKPIYAHGSSAQTISSPGFNAQLAEIEVDRETGEVHVHRLVVIQDVGKAINPMAVHGQLMGGATQGIGWALYEKMAYDDNGQLLTGSWMDYTIPSFTQSATNIETQIVEVPSENGPFGARGVGEPPVIPTASAIANAIADATGVRMTELPMTAPKVLDALSEAKIEAK